MRTYDNNYTFDDMILPISINYDLFSHKLLNEMTYQWDNNLWINNTNIQYYYSDFNNQGIVILIQLILISILIQLMILSI